MTSRAPWMVLLVLVLGAGVWLWVTGSPGTLPVEPPNVPRSPVEETPQEPVLLAPVVAPRVEEVAKPVVVLPPEPEDAAPKETPFEPYAITVRVVDEGGTPVEGLPIAEHFRWEPGTQPKPSRPIGRTDAAGELVVSIEHEAMGVGVGSSDEWFCEKSLWMPDDRDLPVLEIGRSIVVTGTALDEQGNPMVGVKPLMTFSGRSERGSTERQVQRVGPADERGQFRVAIPYYATEVTFRLMHPTLQAEATFDPRTQRRPIVQLKSQTFLEGVMIGPDGVPFHNVTITAIALDRRSRTRARIDTTTGTFRVRVPPGRYRLEARPTVPDAVRAEVLVTAPKKNIRIMCPKGYVVTGSIDVRSQVSWVVWCVQIDASGGASRGTYARAEWDGTFRIEQVPSGSSVLYVYRQRGGDDRYGLLNVQSGATDVAVSLQKGASIAGKIDGYTGHKGFDLYLRFYWRGPTRWVSVADDGTFEVKGLPPGAYRVKAKYKNQEIDLGLSVDAGTRDLTIPMPTFDR